MQAARIAGAARVVHVPLAVIEILNAEFVKYARIDDIAGNSLSDYLD